VSKCPDYYLTIEGKEFWKWYLDNISPPIEDELNIAQHHALSSACEYIFRAGVKTKDPQDDYRKAMSLLSRLYEISDGRGDAMHEIITLVETAIGRVMIEKMRKVTAEKPEIVSRQIYETIWGQVKS
jgi:hypothetical protein